MSSAEASVLVWIAQVAGVIVIQSSSIGTENIFPGIWINLGLCWCQLPVFFKLFKEQIELTSLAESFWRSCFFICLFFEVVRMPFSEFCLSVTVGISHRTLCFGDWRKVTEDFIHRLVVWVFWTFHVFSDQSIHSCGCPSAEMEPAFFLVMQKGALWFLSSGVYYLG